MAHPRHLVVLCLLVACTKSAPDQPPVSPEEAAPNATEVPMLPPSMVGTYVPERDAESGRILIISTDMLAAVECADCGVPVYARMDHISCADEANCEFETEACTGDMVRSPDGTLAVSARPRQSDDKSCEAFAGSFVPGEVEGSRGQVVAASEATPGRVMVGEIRSPHEVDLDASRQIVEEQVERLDACYVTALESQPALAGEFELELVQGLPEGKNKRPRVSETTVSAPALESCVSDVLFELSLPGAADGTPAPVYYRLRFVPR